jgi:insertion element IS1 protein InsB
MNRLAVLLRGSAQAVLTWSRPWAPPYPEQPEPTGSPIVRALAELGHDRKTKRPTLWMGKARERAPGPRLAWAWGRRDQASRKHRVERWAPWDVQRSGTDNWATSASVLPQDQLVQRKATTQARKRHHGRRRHWCGRFTRQSIMSSKAKAMVERTMALCAKFWVNGNQDELLSLLT